MKSEKVYIYGRHALTEAIKNNPSVVKKVFLADSVQDKELRDSLNHHKIAIGSTKDQVGVGKDVSHQGIIATIDTGTLMQEFSEFVKTLIPTKSTCLVLLDEIQDPQNVGAIIRSAAAFGASAVLLPTHNQAHVTGAVVKASVGMVFAIPLILIGNVNTSLRALKDKGFWIYGLAMDGAQPLSKEVFDAPAVFVIGNEGEGIREKTLELCDIKLAINMHPRTESLNAAVSAGVVLHQWSTQHQDALL